ncbi:universal stress protein [Nonomuraea phyllanthi]|uniref:Universal stress protein n=1 Tax=Nonomuraea phyllanthi TaxID=2219224 RepID=A0A5C4WPS2_9ACTN|nr:universal stress protein [Nonomuraea phyllanthi]KAB8195435.1 universal stress protein [Nonomuraea phyllanthi]QFY10431.1 universal stress protein [Nonomuraea phyllanthi]
MSDEYAGRPVLVGYDDSPESRHALQWAIEEARLRRLPLLVCHALHWPYAPRPIPQEIVTQIEQVALGVVDEGVRLAAKLAPELDVRPLLSRGTPSAVLLEAARHAAMTVLGSRGQGGFDGLRVGSAAVQVSAHSVTPVVVVRPSLQPPSGQDARIVVGLDGSPSSRAAFDFALDEAALRGGTVRALCCWADPGSSSWQEPLPFVDSHALRAGAEARFREVAALLARRHPEVTVVTEFVTERPQRVLIDATKDATLLVLGNRGNECPPGLLLGQVTQTALLEAWCPVAVTAAAVPNPLLPPG